MELKTDSIRLALNPAHGRISFFAGKDNRPLLLNAGYCFSFGTRAGGKVRCRLDYPRAMTPVPGDHVDMECQ